MPFEAKLVLAGLIVGAIVGLTGMGGGALMTPILILVGIPPTTAVGTDLAYAAITKTVGAWRHHKLEHVNLRIVFWLACGSVPAAVLGVVTLDKLREHMGADVEDLIQTILGGALVAVGIVFAVKTLLDVGGRDVDVREVRLKRWHGRAFSISVGLIFGYLLGLTSVGSGTFFGMALIIFFRLRAARVVGTDIFHAAVLVWAGAISHALITHTVEFGTVGWLLIGSIPGILVGSHYTARAPERFLRVGLATVLTVSGVSLFVFAH